MVMAFHYTNSFLTFFNDIRKKRIGLKKEANNGKYVRNAPHPINFILHIQTFLLLQIFIHFYMGNTSISIPKKQNLSIAFSFTCHAFWYTKNTKNSQCSIIKDNIFHGKSADFTKRFTLSRHIVTVNHLSPEICQQNMSFRDFNHVESS